MKVSLKVLEGIATALRAPIVENSSKNGSIEHLKGSPGPIDPASWLWNVIPPLEQQPRALKKGSARLLQPWVLSTKLLKKTGIPVRSWGVEKDAQADGSRPFRVFSPKAVVVAQKGSARGRVLEEDRGVSIMADRSGSSGKVLALGDVLLEVEHRVDPVVQVTEEDAFEGPRVRVSIRDDRWLGRMSVFGCIAPRGPS